jgi:MarR family transcriptional regulator for hemolysin
MHDIEGASLLRTRQPPETERGMRGIGGMVRRLHRAFISKMQVGLAGHHLTVSQWRHLRTLWDEEGITQVELARRVGVERAASTSVLDSLEHRGLIRRFRDADDRRKSNLYLTKEGVRILDAALPTVIHINRGALHGFSKPALATLMKMISTVGENLTRVDPLACQPTMRKSSPRRTRLAKKRSRKDR